MADGWVGILCLACLCGGLAAGMTVGKWFCTQSLLIGAERDDRTPHKLGGGFYYLVPESEYCRMSGADLRERIAREDAAPPGPGMYDPVNLGPE